MQISIVIPAYNEEARIGECLRAVQRAIASGPHDAEIVVVNNASTDRTKEIALSFPDARVVDEPQKGLTYARQAGYLASSGTLIANIDADTLMPPAWLKKVVEEFARDPELAALSGPHDYFDLPWFYRMLSMGFYGFAYLTYLVASALRIGGMLQGGNYVVTRAALTRIGGYNTSTITFYGEDVDVARRLAKAREKVRWTFALPMPSSGRRLAAEGMVRMGFRYTLNYFWTTFFGRPLTTIYKDIRPVR